MPPVSHAEVAFEIKTQLTGISPLVAVLGFLPPNKILLGRDGQRWLVTVEEIPSEERLRYQ